MIFKEISPYKIYLIKRGLLLDFFTKAKKSISVLSKVYEKALTRSHNSFRMSATINSFHNKNGYSDFGLKSIYEMCLCYDNIRFEIYKNILDEELKKGIENKEYAQYLKNIEEIDELAELEVVEDGFFVNFPSINSGKLNIREIKNYFDYNSITISYYSGFIPYSSMMEIIPCANLHNLVLNNKWNSKCENLFLNFPNATATIKKSIDSIIAHKQHTFSGTPPDWYQDYLLLT